MCVLLLSSRFPESEAAFRGAPVVEEKLRMGDKNNKPDQLVGFDLQEELHVFETSPELQRHEIQTLLHPVADVSSPAYLNLRRHLFSEREHETLVEIVYVLGVEQQNILCPIAPAYVIKHQAILGSESSQVDLVDGRVCTVVRLLGVGVLCIERWIVEMAGYGGIYAPAWV